MKRFFMLCVMLAASLAVVPAPSLSQEEVDSIASGGDTMLYRFDEVVVTGTRAQRKIIDIPYPVARLNNVQYRYDRKVAINDVLSTVPGLFMQSRYGNHDVRISIRGFGSRSNSGIRGVRILLDDIPESEPDGQTRIEAIDFNSVGSIEVVKGNASSLYTNAPGGVVNFINDNKFLSTFAVNFNDFGSFGLRRNGIKMGIRTADYGFLLAYTYHNYRGYRAHSEDYWNILNTVYETTPSDNSHLQILGYFVDGLIRLPGSLTKAEYDQDPMQAAKDEVNYDFRRLTKKGRIGLRYNTYLDLERRNEIEVTTYGTIKYFERADKNFRIMTRYGIGASTRFLNRSVLAGKQNEFSFGTDLFYQTGPVEKYGNISGKKDDNLKTLIDETIGNVGFYLQNSLDLYDNRLSLLLTGRYDKVVFDQQNRRNESQNDIQRFEAFTPKAALNFKLTPSVSAYTSYGLSFDSPAGNELDNFPLSSNPGKLLNPDLKPQTSKNFEVGVKGNMISLQRSYLNNVAFEATFFNSIIDDEIVPFEVYGSVYYRNSAKTARRGIELGGDVQIYGGLRLTTAYTFSAFKYDTYVAQTIELVAGNIVTSESQFSGNFVPSVPKHNLMTALSYERPLMDWMTAFVKGQYQHIGGLYVDDANTTKTNGYNLFNTTLGLDIVMGRFNVLCSGGVNNLFGAKYVGFVNINSATKRFYETGEPRSYFGNLQLGYTFQ